MVRVKWNEIEGLFFICNGDPRNGKNEAYPILHAEFFTQYVSFQGQCNKSNSERKF